jgi:hypothetical protein
VPDRLNLGYHEYLCMESPSKQRTLDEFLLSADCADCHKAIHGNQDYLFAGNPSVLWKFHLACWDKLPTKFRRSLDIYGGTRSVSA